MSESEFIWTSGKYTVAFNFQSPSKFNYIKKEYAFSLSQDDINELKKNIDTIKLDIAQRAKLIALKDFIPKEISWIWRNPILKEVP
jgi:hypothetical protein